MSPALEKIRKGETCIHGKECCESSTAAVSARDINSKIHTAP